MLEIAKNIIIYKNLINIIHKIEVEKKKWNQYGIKFLLMILFLDRLVGIILLIFIFYEWS